MSKQKVKREILSSTTFDETRIAILENSRLVELLWARQGEEDLVGNIYKGTVENVLPGISSAFVNIGFEKNAYLYISRPDTNDLPICYGICNNFSCISKYSTKARP